MSATSPSTVAQTMPVVALVWRMPSHTPGHPDHRVVILPGQIWETIGCSCPAGLHGRVCYARAAAENLAANGYTLSQCLACGTGLTLDWWLGVWGWYCQTCEGYRGSADLAPLVEREDRAA